MSLEKQDHEIISESSSISPNRVDNYPESLRILVVDSNPVCLQLLITVLRKCCYQYTVTTDTAEAYNILKKNRNGYDLVLTDVTNSMDGCKFAQLIDIEMGIPVIIMSADDGQESVMNCIKHGAVHYLVKPVRYEELKVIWQHVVRKNYFRLEKTIPDITETNPNAMITVRNMDETNDPEGEVEAQLIKENKKLLPKKPRFSWKKEMHAKFENVVARIGVDNAVPKKILELMNEPMLTRENVASHLQKFRKSWHKKKEKAKRLTSECEKAIRSSMHCSGALPNYIVNQCITGQHYQNSSVEPTGTNLHSFGAQIRAISSNNLVNGMAQNHLRFASMGEQMSRITEYPVNDTSVMSSHPSQHIGPKQEVDGMRFNPYSRPTENDHFRDNYSCPSGGYNHSTVPPNSSSMLPPNSTSYGQLHRHGRNHSTQMVHPINSSPMLPSSSPYEQTHMAELSYSTDQMAQPINHQPMITQSFSHGNSFDFKGKEENNSLSIELSLESITWEFLDQTFLNSDIGSDLPNINDMEDEVDAVTQSDDNSAPSI